MKITKNRDEFRICTNKCDPLLLSWRNDVSLRLDHVLSRARQRQTAGAAVLAGEPLDAATALACGLANAVAPAAELRARARAAAEALTKRPAGSLNHTKALMRDMDRIASQISREGALFRERL